VKKRISNKRVKHLTLNSDWTNVVVIKASTTKTGQQKNYQGWPETDIMHQRTIYTLNDYIELSLNQHKRDKHLHRFHIIRDWLGAWIRHYIMLCQTSHRIIEQTKLSSVMSARQYNTCSHLQDMLLWIDIFIQTVIVFVRVVDNFENRTAFLWVETLLSTQHYCEWLLPLATRQNGTNSQALLIIHFKVHIPK
jgi:hypothetical protein